LCDDHREDDRVFSARELPRGESAPNWIELFPAGPEIKAVDGRKFRISNPQTVIDAFKADPNPIPLDYEHATEIRGPEGLAAPAAGWIVELEERGGAIWARIDWTPAGAEAVKNKEYRYVSPAFFQKKGEVVELISAGLTNKPALRMTALARAEEQLTMDPEKRKALCKALGLPETATDEQMVAASEKIHVDHKAALDTARAESPSLANFVPRADYDKQTARVAELETAEADRAKKALDAEIDAEITAATKAGKITPATVDYHKAQCLTDGGLERFRAFVKSSPKVVDDTDLDNQTPGETGEHGLTPAQLKIAEHCGQTAEEFATGKVS
jgi:phage I-like protein